MDAIALGYGFDIGYLADNFEFYAIYPKFESGYQSDFCGFVVVTQAGRTLMDIASNCNSQMMKHGNGGAHPTAGFRQLFNP